MAYTTFMIDESRIGDEFEEFLLYLSNDNGYTWEYYASYYTYDEMEHDMHMLGLLDEMDANV